jgi:hypothetical protein
LLLFDDSRVLNDKTLQLTLCRLKPEHITDSHLLKEGEVGIAMAGDGEVPALTRLRGGEQVPWSEGGG